MSSTNINESPVKVKITEQQRNKKFQELYNQSSRKKKKLQQLKEQRQRQMIEKELKQCTFQPKVNEEVIIYGSNSSSFIKREEDWLNRKEKKIEEMAKMSQTKVIQGCSFHPTISSKSIQILDNSCKLPQNQKKFSKNNLKNQGNSYKEIYKRKEAEKQDSSVFLMTQKRSEMKKLSQEQKFNHPMELQNNTLNEASKKQISFSSEINDGSVHELQAQQHTERIMNKTEEQDTFNSLSSMELKTERKQENQEQKQKIMILEEQIEANQQICENQEPVESSQSSEKQESEEECI